MQVTVRLDNGETVKSDYHTRAEIMAEEGLTEAELNMAIEQVKGLCANIADLKSFKVTVNGEEVQINPSKILWIKLDTED